MKLRVAGLILLLFVPHWSGSVAIPGQATNLNAKYVIDSWETEDGLPQNSVISIAQTPDGYLWFATFTGLVRFDGVKLTVYDPSNTPGFPSPCAVSLYVDRQGRLWVSTDNGVGCLQNRQWRFFHEAEGWSSGYAVSFVEDGDGNLLASTIGKKILRFTGDRFVEFSFPQIKIGPSPLKCVADKTGALWAKGDKYFGRFQNGKWVEVSPAKNFSPRLETKVDWFGIAAGRDRGIWLADSRRIRKYEEGQWTRTLELGVDLQESLSLFEDSNGNVWAGAWQSGLFFFSADGEMHRFTAQDGLRHDAVRTIFEDREGNIWVGTDGGGVTRFKQRTFFTYDKAAGLPENIVNTVAEESPGKMLVGTHGGGLVRLENGRFSRPISGIKLEKNLWVHSVLVDKRGAIWAAVLHEGLFRISGWRAQPVALGSYDATFIRVLYEDSRGAIWLGGDGGLLSFTDGSITRYGTDQGLPPVKVRAIIEDHAGDLWVGTRDDGIFRRQQGRFAEFTRADGSKFGIVRAFYVDAQGTLWIGTTGHGLCRFRAGSVPLHKKMDTERERGNLTEFTEAQGFPFGSITAILEDDFGYFWLGSDKGVIRISRDELNALAGGGTQRLHWQIFHKSDGLNTQECNSGYQPAACKASDGRLWFAMTKGLAVVDPKRYQPNAKSPPVWIERAVVDRNNQALDRSSHQRLTVPAGSKRLQIHYTGLSFVAPEKMRFSYRLDGLDADWVEVGTHRVASFQDLRPGQYRFCVRATNNDGVPNEIGDSLLISVQPFFWQTWWFRGLGVFALIAGAGGVAWRIQENKLRRQREHLAHQRALAEERAQSEEKIRQLNAELEQRVCKRTAQLEATNRELEAFSYSVSHDLRAPLRHIDSFVGLLQKYAAASLDEKGRRYCDLIADSTQRMDRLITDLLAFSRINRSEIQRAPVDFRKLASGVIKEFSPDWHNRAVEWQVGELPVVHGDAAMLRVVLVNLLANALKFTRQRERATIEINSACGSSSEHTIFVRDNGIGFDMQYAYKLFGVFERLHNSIEFGGTGIGLATVRRIIHRHGGQTWAEGQINAGATFYFSLPKT